MTDAQQSTKLKFPAAFSKPIVAKIVERLDANDVQGLIVDPFAGPGLSLHHFAGPKRAVVGIEIEWGNVERANNPRLLVGDSTDLRPFLGRKRVSAYVTSPTYGNRFADHHTASDQSRRRSYTHDIRETTGDPTYTLDANNTGLYYFHNEEYKTLHKTVWEQCTKRAARGCLFLLNVSNFMKGDEEIKVAQWHERVLLDLGWQRRHRYAIKTRRMKYGANRDRRARVEWLYEFVRP